MIGLTDAGWVLACIKGHGLSSFLIIVFGYMAYTYSLELFVVFWALVSVIFALESEKYARRMSEKRHLEELLQDILNRLDLQALTTLKEPIAGKQVADGNPK